MNQDIDILVGYLSIPEQYIILQPTFPIGQALMK